MSVITTQSASLSEALAALGQIRNWSRAIEKVGLVIEAAAGAEQVTREAQARLDAIKVETKRANEEYHKDEVKQSIQRKMYEDEIQSWQDKSSAASASYETRRNALDAEMQKLIAQRDQLQAAVAALRAAASTL